MRTLTTVTVSSRPDWFQVTMFPIDSDELATRIRDIAAADWRRFHGYRRIEVTATDNRGNVRSHVIQPWPGVCPHCGRGL